MVPKVFWLIVFLIIEKLPNFNIGSTGADFFCREHTASQFYFCLFFEYIYASQQKMLEPFWRFPIFFIVHDALKNSRQIYEQVSHNINIIWFPRTQVSRYRNKI